VRAVASGWRLVGSFRALSGPYLSVAPGSDRALNSQAGTQRVNQVLDDPYDNKSINPANDGLRFLNPNAFAQPAFGTLGTMQRNSIKGIGYKNADLSLTRLFRVTNTHTLEVRLEAFNAFNWFGWGAPSATAQGQPNTTLSSATFGQITSAGDPRFLQLGIKYAF